MIRAAKRSQPNSLRCNNRHGVSLLEVTVGMLMASMIAIMASGIAVDLTRHMADNIAETQIISEARIAVETLRRDFGGSSQDDELGEPMQWRLVGRMIPTISEMRLCFDSSTDATADWIAPDRVVIYSHVGDQLIRSDQLSGNSYTVARYVDDVQFVAGGGEISIIIDFAFAGATESYTFVTSDIL